MKEKERKPRGEKKIAQKTCIKHKKKNMNEIHSQRMNKLYNTKATLPLPHKANENKKIHEDRLGSEIERQSKRVRKDRQ